MSSANRPARLNRALLGLFGLALIAAGGYALATHFGRLNWVDARAALLPNHDAPRAWMLWAVVAMASLVGPGCLCWAIAQVPRADRATRWHARAKDSADTTLLNTATACAPVAADIEAYDGVRSARARLSGPGRGPHLHLVVTASPDVDIPGLRDRIRAHALPRLCQALEIDTLPVRMEVRLAHERPPAAHRQAIDPPRRGARRQPDAGDARYIPHVLMPPECRPRGSVSRSGPRRGWYSGC